MIRAVLTPFKFTQNCMIGVHTVCLGILVNSGSKGFNTSVPVHTLTGLPRSGKNIWKMKFFPGQGKVREFCGWPGKFRKDLESQGI